MFLGVVIWALGYYSVCPSGANCGGNSPGTSNPGAELAGGAVIFFVGLAFVVTMIVLRRRGSQRGARVPTPSQVLGVSSK